MHLFFVDTSAGQLTQRTHLPVRPYITQRGKRTHRRYGAAVILIHPHVLACIPLNRRKWLRCRDVPIMCVRRLFNLQIFPDTYRALLNEGYYFAASVLCGHIRRPVEPTDAPAGTSLHHASRKTHPSRVWGGGYFVTSARFGTHPIERVKMIAM